MFADQGDKPHLRQGFAADLVSVADGTYQGLVRTISYGDDEPASIYQLIEQWLWNVWRGGGDDHSAVRRSFRPTFTTISVTHMNVVIAQLAETLSRRICQLPIPLGGVYFAGKPAQHSGPVTRPGADFQHPVSRLDLRRLRHQGNNVGLRNRLGVADGQGCVRIRSRTNAGSDEQVAWHDGDGIKDFGIADATPLQLLLYHLPTSGCIYIVQVLSHVGQAQPPLYTRSHVTVLVSRSPVTFSSAGQLVSL